MSIRLLVIEDHVWVREGLQYAFQNTDIHIVAEVEAGESVVKLLEQYLIDVALLDVKPLNYDGFELIARLRFAAPHLPLIVYSAVSRPDIVQRCAGLGVKSFIVKGTHLNTLIDALIAVSRGDEFWGQEGRGVAYQD